MVDAITTKEEFSALVDSIEADPAYPGKPAAFALGLATLYENQLLDLRFPHTNVGENFGSAAVFWKVGHELDSSIEGENEDPELMTREIFGMFENDGQEHPNLEALHKLSKTYDWIPVQGEGYVYTYVLAWVQDFDQPPANWADAWLRLTLLSETKRQPNSMNLDGIFGLLPNLAWTELGPVVPESAWDMNDRGVTKLSSLDKFPPMLDYVIPPGVRVADASRVRLGAYLSDGTTIMHEGFVNFNAGTLGKSMVKGRISQGVVVGDGSDIGGGASIMGTLSGGGTEKITIGKGCLLGANSGIGISLGDNCVVEAGLYVTAGTKVTYCPKNEAAVMFKAADLSRMNSLLFRRNSRTGEVEAIDRTDASGIELNAALHANAAPSD